MCGIVGLLVKTPALREKLGELMVPMLIGMTERGPDSAGLDGIERDLDPGEPHNQNLYALSEEELKANAIEILPQNLHEALLALEKDSVLCKALGPVADEFLRLKHMEWVEYMRHVSDWEIKNYLEFF